MTIEELTKFTGIEAASMEEFKSSFQDKYLLRENAHRDEKVIEKFSGHFWGAQETKLKQIFKNESIELSDEDLAEIQKKPKDRNEAMVAIALNKLKGNYINQIEELNKKVGQSDEQATKDLNEKIAKLEKERNDIKAAWKSTANEFDAFKVESATKMKQNEINLRLGEEKKRLKFKQNLSPAEQAGFDAIVASKLKFDLDETTREVKPFTITGESIKSKVKAGDFASLGEALQDIVNEIGLGETNPHGNKQVNMQREKTVINNPSGETKVWGERKIHPRAL